jgi:hypothetical protein
MLDDREDDVKIVFETGQAIRSLPSGDEDLCLLVPWIACRL